MEGYQKGECMKKTYLIDLDGTMYRGTEIIDGAKDFISYLIAHEHPFCFLTNNAMRTKRQNVEHMEKMGFQGIEEKHFFTSSMAAARYMAKQDKTKRRAWMIGQDGLREALLEQGFTITKEQADYMFVGLNRNCDYNTYSEALDVILHGAQLVGTNTDRLLAKPGGFQMGNGAIVAMFEYACGQESPKIGKPYAPILEECLTYFNLTKNEAVILGDNLETDILLGAANGVETIMVTSGVHHEDDIERLQIYPDRIIHNVRELIE